MAGSGNRHCANCIGALSLPICRLVRIRVTLELERYCCLGLQLELLRLGVKVSDGGWVWVIDVARRGCGARSKVYVTVQSPSVHLSVRPSVCPIDRQQQWRPAGLLLNALRDEISIKGCGRRAAGAGAQQQMRKASR